MFKKQKCFDKTNVIYNFLITLKDNKCRRELIVVEFHRFFKFWFDSHFTLWSKSNIY